MFKTDPEFGTFGPNHDLRASLRINRWQSEPTSTPELSTTVSFLFSLSEPTGTPEVLLYVFHPPHAFFLLFFSMVSVIHSTTADSIVLLMPCIYFLSFLDVMIIFIHS